LEETDDLKANVITFKFIAFKASGEVNVRNIPRKM